jgi:hypothetical protein
MSLRYKEAGTTSRGTASVPFDEIFDYADPGACPVTK